MNEEFLQRHYGGFRLRDWAREGVDVTGLLSVRRHLDTDTGLFHGEMFCLDFRSPNVLPAAAAPLTLDSRLCETCWDAHLPPELLPQRIELSRILFALSELRSERQGGLSPTSLARMASPLAALSECVLFRPWALRVRSEVVEALLSVCGDRVALREELLVKISPHVSRPSPAEALVYVPPSPRSPLAGLLTFELELLLAWWVVDAPVPGLLFRMPLDAAELVYGQMRDRWMEPAASTAVLEEADSLEVVSTAVALLDPSSDVLSSIRSALEVARSL